MRFLVTATAIIGTPRVYLKAHDAEPDPMGEGYSTIRNIDGKWRGTHKSAPMPADVRGLPGGHPDRVERCKAIYEARKATAESACRAAIDEHDLWPTLVGVKVGTFDGEIILTFADADTAREWSRETFGEYRDARIEPTID